MSEPDKTASSALPQEVEDMIAREFIEEELRDVVEIHAVRRIAALAYRKGLDAARAEIEALQKMLWQAFDALESCEPAMSNGETDCTKMFQAKIDICAALSDREK